MSSQTATEQQEGCTAIPVNKGHRQRRDVHEIDVGCWSRVEEIQGGKVNEPAAGEREDPHLRDEQQGYFEKNEEKASRPQHKPVERQFLELKD